MTTNRPDDELNCEEYYNEVVDHLDNEDNPRELNIARGILLVSISNVIYEVSSVMVTNDTMIL